ncbi:co-chaperone HscB [Catenovulum agarivorans DS-2]|uniref:Co-chaperone protein HscB homolog n=1 Tax=Catenovulum agarivorans DS-2 TaxID=1328313 RepID=W7QKA0_9ALTE|nr:co-chaperone HscB [Catenovulum agarivorans]EWH12341.1 co-chaperone HscB [Catenovulum agarivorans DS-2]
MNFFEIFDFEPAFDLDVNTLSARYKNLQRAFHPDQYASANESQKLLALRKATEINDAYATLKSATSRAEYLLKLAGLDISHETTTVKDPSFLMQQMEYRERLEDISALSDPYDAIVAFEEELEAEQAELEALIGRELKSAHYEQAANAVRKLKFVNKLQTELERLEDEASEI